MKIHRAVRKDRFYYTLCTNKLIVELLATQDNNQVTCKRCLRKLSSYPEKPEYCDYK